MSDNTSDSPPSAELIAQYQALREGAGISDLSDRSQVALSGRDRASFLHNLCTNVVKDLPVNDGCEAFLLNVQGKVVGHAYVFCLSDSILLDSAAGQAETMIAHLDRYVIREDVQLTDLSGRRFELLVGGSRAETLLAGLLTAKVPSRVMSGVEAELEGVPVSVRRVDLTGPDSFLVSGPREAVHELLERLVSQGAVRCARDAFEMLRIESGSPLYGRDISDQNLPQEVARDRQAIDFKKGCYLGQETVARIDALGHVNWTLTGLAFDSPELPAAGSELRIENKTVARVTSSAFSPRLQSPLALAYVRRGFQQPGTCIPWGGGKATVIQLPLAGSNSGGPAANRLP